MSVKLGLLSLFVYCNNWECKTCLLHRVAGCRLFRDFLSTEVNGKTVRISRSVCYIIDIRYEVCLLSRVSLYLDWKLYMYV